MTNTLRLTTRSSHLAFRDAIEAGQPFTTSGALKGESRISSVVGKFLPGLGRLPRSEEGNIRGADYVVYSYATPIAWRTQGQWVAPAVKYSPTTSRHQSVIFAAVEAL